MQKIRRTTSGGQVRYKRGPFLTEHLEEGRELTITLGPTFAELRLKGTRHGLMLPYACMWTRASQIKADEVRKAKRAARKARRHATAA